MPTARIHLEPAFGPCSLGVDSALRALDAYWGEPRGSGLAAQGPDYYDAACSFPTSRWTPEPGPGPGGFLAAPGARDPGQLEFGDLAWATLLVGRPSPVAAQALLRATLEPIHLPSSLTLAEADDGVVAEIADLIWRTQTALKGVRTAITVKMLHPKRPSLIPVIDNQNFFGSYMSSTWRPGGPTPSRSPRNRTAITDGLRAFQQVLAAPQNQPAWESLDRWCSRDGAGPFPRTVLLDMLWWSVRHGAVELSTQQRQG
ncbi:MAG: DUF6308 family protein [Actinomycetes bacterium]